MIKIENLSKSFGEVKAVDDLSFEVREGELFAFLGVNGAGKSTTINIICGQLEKDSGTVSVGGHDLDEESMSVKSTIGVVFQGSHLDRALSVYDNLKSRASLYGIVGKAFEERVTELALLLDFKDLLKRNLGKLSGGQRQRIAIARVFLKNPKLLILDEATSALDNVTEMQIQASLEELSRGRTVIVVAHRLSTVKNADEIVVINKTGIVERGSHEELIALGGEYQTLYSYQFRAL